MFIHSAVLFIHYKKYWDNVCLARFAWILMAAGGLSGCNWIDEKISPPQSHINDIVTSYKVQKNVKYGKEALQTFDLYLPESENGNPSEIVFIIHGGAWYYGDKSWMTPTVDSLLSAKKNLAIVNMNYRLVPGPGKIRLVTKQLDDIDSCVHFVLRNAEDYNIRKSIVLSGVSAGGHLALLYTYARKNRDISAVVGISAYTELSERLFMDSTLRRNVENLIGEKYGDSLEVFKNASPLYLANPRVPPTVVIYGGKDDRTIHQQGRLLVAKLQSMNVPNSFDIYPDEDHNITAKPVATAILDVYGTKKLVIMP